MEAFRQVEQTHLRHPPSPFRLVFRNPCLSAELQRSRGQFLDPGWPLLRSPLGLSGCYSGADSIGVSLHPVSAGYESSDFHGRLLGSSGRGRRCFSLTPCLTAPSRVTQCRMLGRFFAELSTPPELFREA